MEGIRDTRYLVVLVHWEIMQDEPSGIGGLKTPLVTLDKRKEMGLVAEGPAKCLSLSL